MKLKLIFTLIGLLIFTISGFFIYNSQINNSSEIQVKDTTAEDTIKYQDSIDENQKIIAEKDQKISLLENQKLALEKQITNLNLKIKSISSDVALRDKEISELKKTSIKNSEKLEDLSNKVNCQELIKKTPDRGPGAYMNIDIVRFYESSIESLNSTKDNPDDPEEAVGGRKFWQDIINEAKPMYENYMKKCK